MIIKDRLYKLKNTLYQDDFYNTISNEAVYKYDSVKKKEILTTPLWARKGELFYVIKVTKENFDKLDNEYGLSYDDSKNDIKLVIVHKTGHKWFFSYNDEYWVQYFGANTSFDTYEDAVADAKKDF